MVQFITFTGVDIKTDISRVNRLSERYNVEWGVLYSPSKKDDDRYSSYETVSELVNKIHKPALHLCGKAINQLINIDGDLELLLRDMFVNDNRVQLNTNLSSLSKTKLKTLINYIEIKSNKFILQFNENNKDYISLFPENVDVLYDASGGNGLEINEYLPPISNRFCGYAGGLGEENITEAVTKADKVSNNYWLDMESKIRTDGYLDLNLCETILEKVYG
jgi:phosphoribosylanthranilate isomerase